MAPAGGESGLFPCPVFLPYQAIKTGLFSVIISLIFSSILELSFVCIIGIPACLRTLSTKRSHSCLSGLLWLLSSNSMTKTGLIRGNVQRRKSTCLDLMRLNCDCQLELFSFGSIMSASRTFENSIRFSSVAF